jgi:hypothetical protein
LARQLLFLGAVVWEEIDSDEDMEVAVGLKGGRVPFSRQRPMSNLSQHRRHDFRLSCHLFLLNFLELDDLLGSHDLEYDSFLLETNDGLSSGVREQCREQVDPVP